MRSITPRMKRALASMLLLGAAAAASAPFIPRGTSRQGNIESIVSTYFAGDQTSDIRSPFLNARVGLISRSDKAPSITAEGQEIVGLPKGYHHEITTATALEGDTLGFHFGLTKEDYQTGQAPFEVTPDTSLYLVLPEGTRLKDMTYREIARDNKTGEVAYYETVDPNDTYVGRIAGIFNKVMNSDRQENSDSEDEGKTELEIFAENLTGKIEDKTGLPIKTIVYDPLAQLVKKSKQSKIEEIQREHPQCEVIELSRQFPKEFDLQTTRIGAEVLCQIEVQEEPKDVILQGTIAYEANLGSSIRRTPELNVISKATIKPQENPQTEETKRPKDLEGKIDENMIFGEWVFVEPSEEGGREKIFNFKRYRTAEGELMMNFGNPLPLVLRDNGTYVEDINKREKTLEMFKRNPEELEKYSRFLRENLFSEDLRKEDDYKDEVSPAEILANLSKEQKERISYQLQDPNTMILEVREIEGQKLREGIILRRKDVKTTPATVEELKGSWIYLESSQGKKIFFEVEGNEGTITEMWNWHDNQGESIWKLKFQEETAKRIGNTIFVKTSLSIPQIGIFPYERPAINEDTELTMTRFSDDTYILSLRGGILGKFKKTKQMNLEGKVSGGGIFGRWRSPFLEGKLSLDLHTHRGYKDKEGNLVTNWSGGLPLEHLGNDTYLLDLRKRGETLRRFKEDPEAFETYMNFLENNPPTMMEDPKDSQEILRVLQSKSEWLITYRTYSPNIMETRISDGPAHAAYISIRDGAEITSSTTEELNGLWTSVERASEEESFTVRIENNQLVLEFIKDKKEPDKKGFKLLETIKKVDNTLLMTSEEGKILSAIMLPERKCIFIIGEESFGTFEKRN